MECVERDGAPVYVVERFIEGEYVKHNNNSGYVDTRHAFRTTPHAFSAWTHHASAGAEMIVDVQGVGDLFTDPQARAPIARRPLQPPSLPPISSPLPPSSPLPRCQIHSLALVMLATSGARMACFFATHENTDLCSCSACRSFSRAQRARRLLRAAASLKRAAPRTGEPPKPKSPGRALGRGRGAARARGRAARPHAAADEDPPTGTAAARALAARAAVAAAPTTTPRSRPRGVRGEGTSHRGRPLVAVLVAHAALAAEAPVHLHMAAMHADGELSDGQLEHLADGTAAAALVARHRPPGHPGVGARAARARRAGARRARRGRARAARPPRGRLVGRTRCPTARRRAAGSHSFDPLAAEAAAAALPRSSTCPAGAARAAAARPAARLAQPPRSPRCSRRSSLSRCGGAAGEAPDDDGGCARVCGRRDRARSCAAAPHKARANAGRGAAAATLLGELAALSGRDEGVVRRGRRSAEPGTRRRRRSSR